MRSKWAIAVLLVGAALLGGCQPPCPELNTLASTEVLVSDYNANAAKVPRLWARAKIEISGTHKGLPFAYGSTSPLADPNGLLILQKNNNPLGPQDYVLIFRELSKDMARLGISTKDEVFYTWVLPAESCFYGRLKLAGSPKAKIPLDPVQIQSILTICQLPTKQTGVPFVAQRVQRSKPYAQVLSYMDHQYSVIGRGPVVFKRELYFRWQRDPKDHNKLLPRELFMVKLFDSQGVAVMTAELDKYKEIALEDVADEGAAPPKIPTDIKLTWHDRNEKVHIVLDDMTTADKFDPAIFEFKRWRPASLEHKTRPVN